MYLDSLKDQHPVKIGWSIQNRLERIWQPEEIVHEVLVPFYESLGKAERHPKSSWGNFHAKYPVVIISKITTVKRLDIPTRWAMRFRCKKATACKEYTFFIIRIWKNVDDKLTAISCNDQSKTSPISTNVGSVDQLQREIGRASCRERVSPYV